MSSLAIPVNESDYVRGPADAAVTVVEYGDYECPQCGRTHGIMQTLSRFLSFRFVFRNFPIRELHVHSQQAAEAALLAGAMGQFWPMHDRLLEHQRQLRTEELVQHAAAVGLDPVVFQERLKALEFREAVRAEFLGGVRSGVNKTPTLYLNGHRYDGDLDIEDIGNALRDASG